MNPNVSTEKFDLLSGIEYLEDQKAFFEEGRIIAVELCSSPTIKELSKVQIAPFIFWKSRSKSYSIQGWGCSKIAEDLNQLSMSDCPWFSVNSFAIKQGNSVHSVWRNFPRHLHWQPRFWVKNFSDRSVLYRIVSDEMSPAVLKDDLDSIPTDLPNQIGWTNQIRTAQELFQSTTLNKLVLARQSKRIVDNPWTLFADLCQTQPNCYHFLFSPNSSDLFLGVSPERLFQIQENRLTTEALAGTRAYTKDSSQNTQLQDELKNSKKDGYEHQIVVKYLHDILMPFCTNIEVSSQQLLRLTHVQHLQTPISATLKNDVELQELFDTIHPTPAVSGFPKEISIRCISELEEFDRGYYAGAIGCIETNSIDFTVSIRSALWSNNQLFIWAGAGIVPDSDPDLEWDEINNKAAQFFTRSKP